CGGDDADAGSKFAQRVAQVDRSKVHKVPYESQLREFDKFFGSIFMLPARSRSTVGLTGINPLCRSVRVPLFFPERSAGFQVVHDELAGGKRIGAMSARHTDKHNAVADVQATDAMDNARCLQTPVLLCLLDN